MSDKCQAVLSNPFYLVKAVESRKHQSDKPFFFEIALSCLRWLDISGFLRDCSAQDCPLGSMETPWALRGALLHNVCVPCEVRYV